MSVHQKLCLSLLKKSCLLYLSQEKPMSYAAFPRKFYILKGKHLAEHLHLPSCFKKRKSSQSLNFDRSVLQQEPLNLSTASQQGMHCVISCIYCVCKVLAWETWSRNWWQFLMCLDVGLPRYFLSRFMLHFKNPLCCIMGLLSIQIMLINFSLPKSAFIIVPCNQNYLCMSMSRH